MLWISRADVAVVVACGALTFLFFAVNSDMGMVGSLAAAAAAVAAAACVDTWRTSGQMAKATVADADNVGATHAVRSRRAIGVADRIRGTNSRRLRACRRSVLSLSIVLGRAGVAR